MPAVLTEMLLLIFRDVEGFRARHILVKSVFLFLFFVMELN